MTKLVKKKLVPPWIKKSPLYRNIWNRLRFHNQNYLCAFCGPTGSGKSWASIAEAYALDRDTYGRARFDIDRIVFSIDDFMNLIKQDLPKGSFIIWDETGIGINARTFYEYQNLVISYVTQTFRYKNYGVLYTVPSFYYVDKQVRNLFHERIEMKKPDRREGRSYGKWYHMWQSPTEKQKIYFPFPRYWENDVYYEINEVSFPAPPHDLAMQYEVKKRVFLKKAYEEYSAKMNATSKASSASSIQVTVDKIKKAPEDYMDSAGKIDSGKIMEREACGLNKARVIAKMAREALAHMPA